MSGGKTDWRGVKTVLCLGAHPDDIEIGCGGTLLRLVGEIPELQVRWTVFSGEGERRVEAERSARNFLRGTGRSEIEVLDFPDRYFPSVWADLKRRFDSLGQTIRPDLVLTHRLEDAHQDHRLLAELTWNTFRRHWILEYEIPKYEGDLGRPNLFVSLSETLVRRKAALIEDSYPSQRSKPWFSADTFHSLARLRGLEAHPEVTFAEGFYNRKMVL